MGLKVFFGPATANQVDQWVKEGLSEAQIIEKAQAKVKGFLGNEKLDRFNEMIL
jgi:hypothetical protein